MKAYKRLEPGLICRGYKYPENEWVEFPEAKLCESGAHACLDPLDTNRYYAPADSELHEVEIEDVSDERGDDSKVVAKRIKIGAKLDVAGIIKAHAEYVKERCTSEKRGGDGASVSGGNMASVSGGYMASVSGGYRASVSGGYGASVSGGNMASVSGGNRASVSGGYGASVSGGDGASVSGGYRASVSGGYGASVSGGDRASVSGGNGASVVSRGFSSVGKNGIACARGNGCRVRGGLGALLVIADEKKDDYTIAAWKAVVVDGKTIKPDTWYVLKDGELVEVEHNA